MSDTPIPRPSVEQERIDIEHDYEFWVEHFGALGVTCALALRAYWAEHDLKEAIERAERAEADLKIAKEFARALSRELADEHPDCSNVKAELAALQARIEPEILARILYGIGNERIGHREWSAVGAIYESEAKELLRRLLPDEDAPA